MSRAATLIIATALVACFSIFLFAFRVQAITSLLFTSIILLIFLLQSSLTGYVYFDYILPKYRGKSLPERLVCIPAVAMHELAHAIIITLTRSKVTEVSISPDSGSVGYKSERQTVSSWFAAVAGSLAPSFLFPSLFVALALASGFTVTPTYSGGRGIEPLYAVIDFAIGNFAGFVNWISLNLSNPLIYLFLYLFITSSLGWGPSEEDWGVVGKAIKSMPMITLAVILATIDLLTMVSIFSLSLVTMFYGFLLFIFLLTLLGLALAITITFFISLLTRAVHRKGT